SYRIILTYWPDVKRVIRRNKMELPADAPQVIVRYDWRLQSYGQHSQFVSGLSHPIVLENVSPYPAYGIQIQPIKVREFTITFDEVDCAVTSSPISAFGTVKSNERQASGRVRTRHRLHLYGFREDSY